MKRFGTIIKNNMQQYSMIMVLIGMVVLFQVITGGLLLTPLNMTNIVLQNSYIVILAVGMLPIIISGRVDLSVGSISAVIGAIAAVMMVYNRTNFIVTVSVGLLVGAAIGAWNGYWIAYRNIPAFIATLSSQLIFRGLTVLILDGRSVGPFSNSFQALSSSFLPDLFRIGRLHGTTMILALIGCAALVFSEIRSRAEKRKYDCDVPLLGTSIAKVTFYCAVLLAVTYYFAAHQGFPTVMLIMVALLLIYSFITTKTIIGRHLYALGGNEKSAALSGVNVKKVLFTAFVNMGVLAALAGLVFAARLNAGTPKAGVGFELDAIAACFIGGASVTGGSGTVAGALIGCLVMGVMNNGMSIMGIPVDLQQAIKGLVILFAVAFDMYAKAKQRAISSEV